MNTLNDDPFATISSRGVPPLRLQGMEPTPSYTEQGIFTSARSASYPSTPVMPPEGGVDLIIAHLEQLMLNGSLGFADFFQPPKLRNTSPGLSNPTAWTGFQTKLITALGPDMVNENAQSVAIMASRVRKQNKTLAST
eukprot:324170-Hanusia_phi.AAC.1